MAHFAAYNTSDANTGNTVLAANATIPVLTMQATTEGQIVGSVISDQPGTLLIQQSFDGSNWDVQNSVAVAAATGPGMGVEINQAVFAPWIQVSYTNTGTSTQTYLRLFLRAVGTRTP